jgi:hypothetical protein
MAILSKQWISALKIYTNNCLDKVVPWNVKMFRLIFLCCLNSKYAIVDRDNLSDDCIVVQYGISIIFIDHNYTW